MTDNNKDRVCVKLTLAQMQELRQHAEKEDRLVSEIARGMVRDALRELRSSEAIPASETMNPAEPPKTADPVEKNGPAAKPPKQSAEGKKDPEGQSATQNASA